LREWEGEEGVEWVVREGVGVGGEMTQALYAHMNNKRKKNPAI
jgi:NaMN:DMB phosphoribosyltransferase